MVLVFGVLRWCEVWMVWPHSSARAYPARVASLVRVPFAQRKGRGTPLVFAQERGIRW